MYINKTFFREMAKVLFSALVTLFGLLILTFFIARLLPIDPVLAVVGEQASEAAYERARQDLGLDKSLFQQLILYLQNIVQGDLGQSFLTRNDIVDDLKRVFPATIELATTATIIGVLIGVPLGTWAAAKQDGWPDHVARFLGVLGHSVPAFWLGMIALLIFYAKLGVVPGPGRVDDIYYGLVTQQTGLILVDSLMQGQIEVFRNAVSHLILPATVLGIFSVANISRMTRNFVLAELRQEYVTTARVKGMDMRTIIIRQVLPNTFVSLITVIALQLGALLEGAVLTETIFGWPGLGLYMKNSLLNADTNAVLGGTLLVGVTFILLNTGADALYRILDPRARN